MSWGADMDQNFTVLRKRAFHGKKSEWSLAISVLSLCLAAFSAYYTYNSSNATATRQILASFIATATTLPTASTCFNFATQLDDDRFYDLFGYQPIAFAFTAPAEGQLARCLQSEKLTKQVSASDALKIRQIIFNKLNSFQEIFRAIALGEGHRKTICNEVKTAFQSGPQSFIRRMRSKSPRPALGQNIELDLNYVLEVDAGNLCQR